MKANCLAAATIAALLTISAPALSLPIAQVDLVTTSGPTYRDDQWTLNLSGPIVASVTYTVVPDDEVGSNILNATAHWVDAINADPVVGAFLTAALLPSLHQFTLTADTPGVPFFASVSVFEASQSDNNELEPLSVGITTTTQASTDIAEPHALAALSLGLAFLMVLSRRVRRH